jgi:ATP-dependent Clp protease ATP-binding subunit ClpA
MNDVLQHWAIMGRCTVEARRVVSHALNAVHEFGGSAITLEHFVLGLMAPDVRASAHLTSLPQGGQNLRREIVALLAGSSVPAMHEVPLSRDAMQVMEAARAEADHQGHAHIQSGHLLLAILAATEAPVAGLLHAHGLSAERIRVGMAGSGSDVDDA